MKKAYFFLITIGFIFMIPIVNAKTVNFMGSGITGFDVIGSFSEELTASKNGVYSFNYKNYASNIINLSFTPKPAVEYSSPANSVRFGFVFLADEYISSSYLNLNTTCDSYGGIRDENGSDGRFEPAENYNWYQYGHSDCYTGGSATFQKSNISFSVRVKQGSAYFVCDVTSTTASASGYMIAECPLSESRQYIDGINIYAMRSTGAFEKGTIGIGQFFNFSREADGTDSVVGALNSNSQKEIDAANKNADRAHADSQEQLKESKKQTDFITSDEAPESDISVLGDVQGIFPPGPADSLLNIPFRFLSIVTSSFGGVCTPIETGIWNGVSVFIPCFSELIYDNVPDWLMVYMDLIPAGFIFILWSKHLYKKIERAQSMETNSDDEWGVL